jgi:hypothetical protein
VFHDVTVPHKLPAGCADQYQEHHGVQACWPGSFKGADRNGTR